MLKGVDPLLTPELLAVLAEMGHGDRLVVADRNFPAHSCGARVVDLPGADGDAVLRAVLGVLPVDTFQDPPAWHMRPDDGSRAPSWEPVREALRVAEGRDVAVGEVPRPEFYDLARAAYCVVRTGDSRPYACFAVAKGVL
ncbi:ribose ABC transporter [Actinotalea ferrariae CF5-4]|uniref:Ribose ABC transporter n=1 Tax=Actinotalea ferrariae CF5-4 TaxID=948458 RepID=A0A021VTP7_9CELL|nr:RbsD/FucU domain-containing protein [Actinotalea ferrariae]EYR63405.1 ribose ABC transporter [Actinotalea ferrariae CF5-4]